MAENRSSRKINLVIMGLIGAGIGVSILTSRNDCNKTVAYNVYPSQQACIDDYSVADCRPFGPPSTNRYSAPEYDVSGNGPTRPGLSYQRNGVLPSDVERNESTTRRGGFGCNGTRYSVRS